MVNTIPLWSVCLLLYAKTHPHTHKKTPKNKKKPQKQKQKPKKPHVNSFGFCPGHKMDTGAAESWPHSLGRVL